MNQTVDGERAKGNVERLKYRRVRSEESEQNPMVFTPVPIERGKEAGESAIIAAKEVFEGEQWLCRISIRNELLYKFIVLMPTDPHTSSWEA